MTMDDLLRDTVHGIADEARTAPDLATAAMAKGRRLRRQRRVALATVAAALLGVTTLPYLALRDPAPAPVTATRPWSGERPFPLPGDWVVAAVQPSQGPAGRIPTSATGNLVLNRDSGRYQAVPEVSEIWPAPRGNLVAVANDKHRAQIGVLDLDNGQTRWFERGLGHGPQWSPDGKRLLIMTNSGFAVIDAATGTATAHTVDASRYSCSESCLFTWQPDGRHVGLPLDDPDAPEPAEGALDVPARRGVQLFAADTGRATRLLPVRGNPIGTAAWSPNGTRVLVGEDRSDERHLVEVSTGKVLWTLRAHSKSLYFVDDDRLLELGANHARLLAADSGRVLQEVPLPAGLADHRISATAK